MPKFIEIEETFCGWMDKRTDGQTFKTHFITSTQKSLPKNELLTLSGFSLRYGGSPSIISIAITPRLQMSTFGPYCFLQHTNILPSLAWWTVLLSVAHKHSTITGLMNHTAFCSTQTFYHHWPDGPYCFLQHTNILPSLAWWPIRLSVGHKHSNITGLMDHTAFCSTQTFYHHWPDGPYGFL